MNDCSTSSVLLTRTQSDRDYVAMKDAASKLMGAKKRAFIAQAALDYFDDSARKTERAPSEELIA